VCTCCRAKDTIGKIEEKKRPFVETEEMLDLHPVEVDKGPGEGGTALTGCSREIRMMGVGDCQTEIETEIEMQRRGDGCGLQYNSSLDVRSSSRLTK
jgi:hypothetical protein